MENEKIFELITKMYADLKEGQEKMYVEFKEGQNSLKKEVDKTNITIENEVNPKLKALFDGYKQNSEQLKRIEDEVSKHEEIILRRVK